MVEEAQKLDDGSTVDSDQRSASPGEAAGTEGNGTPEETDLEGSSSGMHCLQCTMYIHITKTVLLVNHLESNAGDRKPKVYMLLLDTCSCVYIRTYMVLYMLTCVFE